MYNSYIHHRNQLKKIEKLSELEKSSKILRVQHDIREKLLNKYKYRVAHRVLDLVNSPVPVYNKVQAKSQKLFGESFMRHKPKDSKARIQEALDQNTILDPQPLYSNRTDFRPRKKEREIQSNMKFTPRDRYQRLVDKWLSEKELITSWELSNDGSNTIRNKMKKVYYKTVETVALNVSPESCSKDNSRILLRQISEESFNDDCFVGDNEKLGILAHTALEKCKLRPDKGIRFSSPGVVRVLK